MQATYQLDEPTAIPLPALIEACATVGDRWSLPVVAALLEGPLRYTELRERLADIAPNILSARLRSLEAGGLIAAHRYSSRPQRFEYRLTTEGAALAEAVRALAGWAARRGSLALAAATSSSGAGGAPPARSPSARTATTTWWPSRERRARAACAQRCSRGGHDLDVLRRRGSRVRSAAWCGAFDAVQQQPVRAQRELRL
jgi:DNA-binding HxlR family transcriptional regulator